MISIHHQPQTVFLDRVGRDGIVAQPGGVRRKAAVADLAIAASGTKAYWAYGWVSFVYGWRLRIRPKVAATAEAAE